LPDGPVGFAGSVCGGSGCAIGSLPVAVPPPAISVVPPPPLVLPPVPPPTDPPPAVAPAVESQVLSTQMGAFAFTGADTAAADSACAEPTWAVPAD
jgi:hypothetical protein